MRFGARLKEERKRLGLKQAEFASLAWTDVPKQSLYENGHRELRAQYLSRLAAAGVDVLYVLTGQRTEGPWLDDEACRFVTAYFDLPAGLRPALARFLEELARHDSSGGRGP